MEWTRVPSRNGSNRFSLKGGTLITRAAVRTNVRGQFQTGGLIGRFFFLSNARPISAFLMRVDCLLNTTCPETRENYVLEPCLTPTSWIYSLIPCVQFLWLVISFSLLSILCVCNFGFCLWNNFCVHDVLELDFRRLIFPSLNRFYCLIFFPI